MFTVGKPESSRYIRTTWMLSAETVLKFADSSNIRLFSADEAEKLAEQVRKRNVFARHSWENNFYIQRVRGLADHTVIEVFRPGDPKEMSNEAERVASTLEKLTILSSTGALGKADLQRKLGISSKPRTETDFVSSQDFHFLRSRARPSPPVAGIRIDEAFCRRFSRCGFDILANYVQLNNEISKRVLLSLDWLFDSRIEPRIPASVVKTSIALESLLIFSESESLAQSLAERAAFILSSNPNRRQQISRILKRFYDARSGIVHGSQRKAAKLTLSLLETVDRLAVLLCLIVAANSKLWITTEALREWCETQRWGAPSSEIKIPFPDTYLRNALALGQKEISLSEVGLGVVALVVVIMSIAIPLHWLSWSTSFHILAQILFGFITGCAALVFVFPRIQLVFGKTNSLTKGVNIFLILFGLVLFSFLLTLLAILWSTPEMNFLEKFFSNLGFVSGIVLSLRMYRSYNRLH